MKYAVFLVFIVIVTVFTLSLFLKSSTLVLPFLRNNSVTKQGKPPITILLGGDVMLGRSVTVQSLDVKHDPSYPFVNLISPMNDADIVFINLENPIIENCPRKTDGMVFCVPPEMLAGFLPNKTVVNIANNHSSNYGNDGITSTIDFLSEAHIFVTGYSQFVTKKIGDTMFGFLGFDKSQQSNPQLSNSERQLIIDSKSKVEVLIVALHWGIEYQKHPTEGQKQLAQELVTLGANVIVGHHPHWVQDVEWIGNTPVYYSLGNLIFDQTWSEETRNGLLVKLTFMGKNIEKQELIPTYIKQIGQPIIMPSPNE